MNVDLSLAGSTELWVDPDCDTASRESVDDEGNSMDSQASSPTYCESIGRYDPSSSTSAKDLQHGTEFVYADGTTIEVNYYTDTIEIGGLTVSKQEFGVANATNATSLGIMGLGPDPVHGYNMTLQTYNCVLDSLAARKFPSFLSTDDATEVSPGGARSYKATIVEI